MRKPCWKLSPSDFAFLWEECKRCFYLKIVNGFPRPSQGFPQIFSVIDSRMKRCFLGTRTIGVAPGIPDGIVEYGEKRVESTPLSGPGCSSTCIISGRIDTALKFDDGTFGVVDYKTSRAKGERVSQYGRQLHAYAHALENPAPGKFTLNPVSKLGLLVFEPEAFVNPDKGAGSLEGRLTWLDIPRDDQLFRQFIVEVLSLLEQPTPPPSAAACQWCQYRQASRSEPW